MRHQILYADCNATHPLLPQVKEQLRHHFQEGIEANPNASHDLGRAVRDRYEQARQELAYSLNADVHQLIFNSGTTEGVAQVFFSLLDNGPSQGKKTLLISDVEHPVMSETALFYRKRGFEIKSIPVSPKGTLDLSFVENNLKEAALLSVMAANNETGVLFPIDTLAQMAQKAEIPFICDTTQLIGKKAFDFSKSGIDFAFCSGHKLGALPGSGFLLAKNPDLLSPLLRGGGQENGLRHGTQNYIAQESLSVAFLVWKEMTSHLVRLEKAKKVLEQKLKAAFPSLMIIGEEEKRLETTSMIAFPGLFGEVIQLEAQSRGLFFTTTSACGDSKHHHSSTLSKMGFSDSVARGAIRLSFSPFHSDDEIEKVFVILSKIYQHLSAITPFLI